MIGIDDLVRFCESTMAIAGGDVRAQLEAWGVDHDQFMQFMTTWAWRHAELAGCDPDVIIVAFFAGFELGYRSCVEADLGR